VLVQYGPAHQRNAFASATFLLAQAVLPVPFWPWVRKPPTAVRKLAWGVWLVMLAPVLVAAFVADVVTAPWLRRGKRASSYRLIARKD
jgi:ABC-type phosphate transport system permease subunit